MTNLEIYEKDPQTHTLLNQGVAKVTSGQSTAELGTLRYELQNFVCDGQYAEGLSRILSTYLGHLDKSEQPGVWVSGFFGSGKSHLVKMLQYLWADFTFEDGAKARGIAKLPAGVKELLTELTTSAKRQGGLHAAAGDLRTEAKESIRLALLGILFKSVGLRGDYSRACFQMWLRDEGLENEVRRFIKNAGGDFEKELTNLYVSKLMAQAILAHRPEFASKPSDVALVLKSQFPPDPKDVSIDDMIDKIMQAVGRKGKLPYTVVILDEVQQYINDDAGRSKAVQDVKEQCCARLGANFLLIGTGQNALSGAALLQRLQGRFPVTVELQDTDVEQVTREVVLKKKPTAEDGLKHLLDGSPEIPRHLANSKIAFTGRDRGLLVQDYPILPVRRRFWERVLRAVDKAGTGAQLRNQLWVVYEAVKQTAKLPIGNVVSGAFIYDASIKSSALQSGTLLQEIAETIEKQKKEVDGALRYQICALIFLIGQLPHNNEPLDAGVRADANTLADLLVTDLNESSADLRKKIPAILEKLVDEGAIARVDNEYLMQTREGQDWEKMFREAKNNLLNNPGKLASAQSQWLRSQCKETLKKFKLVHGESKEPRKIELHFGETSPPVDGSTIPVWVRDGWEVDEKSILNDARAASDATAMVYGFIPKKSADELKQAIAGEYAASTTLQAKGTPSGDEGIHARKAMETRLEQSLRARDSLVTDILNEMQVYLAGGDSVSGTLLNEKIKDAATMCLDRLYPLFHLADSADWPKVIDRAKKGDGDALVAVGHKGDPESHAVSKAILDYVGSGRKGTEIRKYFNEAKYGWSRDAVDAVLLVLTQAGKLQAKNSSGPLIAKQLDQQSIAAAEFRCETITLSKVQLIAIRSVYKAVGINAQAGQESLHAPEFLNRLTRLAESAGGAAPLPKCPDTSHLADMANRVGNDQLKAIFENKDQLTKQIAEWQRDRDLIAERAARWAQLDALLKFAVDLPVAAEVQLQVDAIAQQRKLLANPDPVPGMVEKLTSALRTALNDAHTRFSADYEARMSALEGTPTWKQLTPEQRYDNLGKQGIREMPTIAVGTTEEVLDTLRHTKLSELRAIHDALPTRFNNAAAAAAKLLEPKAQHVHLPGGTIKNDDDLKSWLGAVEQKIREKLKDGPVIV
jgi:hypothetical protein